MTEWNKYPDTFPTKEGKLLVVINGEILVGSTRFNSSPFYFLQPNSIIYFINQAFETTPDRVMRMIPSRGEWVKPKHYADITHWMMIPEMQDEIPKD